MKFHAPPGPSGDPDATANTPGLRHLTFAVDIDAVVASLRAHGGELVGEVENNEDIYRLCYVRPRGSSSSWQSKSAEDAVAGRATSQSSIFTCRAFRTSRGQRHAASARRLQKSAPDLLREAACAS